MTEAEQTDSEGPNAALREEAGLIYRQSLDSQIWDEWVAHADRIAALRRTAAAPGDPELVRLECQVLVEAAYEADSLEALPAAAQRVRNLRESDPSFDTFEIALSEAKILAESARSPWAWEAGAGQPADEIAVLRAEAPADQVGQFAFVEATALANACWGLVTTQQGSESDLSELVERIARLRIEVPEASSVDLVRLQARAMAQVRRRDSELSWSELIACILRELREQDVSLQVPEIAEEEGRSLLLACSELQGPPEEVVAQILGLATRAAALRDIAPGFATLELARIEARCVYEASRVCDEVDAIESLAQRVKTLRHRSPSFQSPVLAEIEAGILVNASARNEDLARDLTLADRVASIRTERPGFQTAEMARLEARILSNASNELANWPEQRLAEGVALADRITALRHSDSQFQVVPIARLEAGVLRDCTILTTDHEARASLARRIRDLRLSDAAFATAEIGLREAQSWMNACNQAPDRSSRESLAAKIAELRSSDPVFDTHEIAMREARALVSTSYLDGPMEDCLAMAERVASMRPSRELREAIALARQEATILLNASCHTDALDASMAIVERIRSIRSSDPELDLPYIAVMEARTLGNASAATKTAEECEPILARITELRRHRPANGDMTGYGPPYARACFNAAYETEDVESCVEYADRIAVWRSESTQFHTPAVALKEVKTLCLASLRSEDAEACAGWADRIADLRATDPSIDTVAIALEEAEILLRALELGIDDSRASGLGERVRTLVRKCDAEADAETREQAEEVSARAARWFERS